MGSTKLTIKQSPRARGTVPLAKVRRVVEEVFAKYNAAKSNSSSASAKKMRGKARVSRAR